MFTESGSPHVALGRQEYPPLSPPYFIPITRTDESVEPDDTFAESLFKQESRT